MMIKITNGKIGEMERMYNAGYTLKEIAGRFGCHINTVRNNLTNIKMRSRGNSPNKAGRI